MLSFSHKNYHMKRRFLGLIGLIAFAATSSAQETLYMPRDISTAYKKGSRSMDGRPGSNYWQNRGRYNITITAMPPDRNIRGSETITYINNSPDTLRSPVIKLLLNVHKPGAPRDQGAAADYLTSGVHIDGYTVNGQKMNWTKNPNVFTNQSIRLPQALLPNDSVQLAFDWHYEISLESGREGMIDSTTYFLAYFYPRVAVYDDYNGWDRMNFVDSKEFYSDFNDYTVTLNTPKNYIVWGTGTLMDPGAVLQPEFADRFKRSLTSDETIRIITPQDLEAKNVTRQNAINSWTFKAVNIPDMAFGVSDHFVWDAGSVIVDNKTGRRASVQAAYNDTAKDYHRMVVYGRNALNYLSNKWPGISYPYEKTTIFHGYAGMEYPMMVNDETYEDTIFSRFVAEHELAHTYMPFYMGINETRYGFMDEGWATAFEFLINQENLGSERASAFFKQFRVQSWIYDPAQDESLPIITPGNILSGSGLGNNEYGKAALGYLAVKDLLGDALFKKSLQEYMSRWNGKHPIPWDFFYTFNDASKKNLNWFWNNWFFSNNYIDLALDAATKTPGGYTLNIRNIGGMAAPVNVVVTYADGSKQTFHQSPAIWEKNQKQATVKIGTDKKAATIRLDGDIFMDADESNNSWKTN
jgi:hypothetical protein